MPKRRNNRKYTRQQPVDQPDNWQEAMERGVFLLNERNRAFVEFSSTEVYLPPLPLKSLIYRVLVVVVSALFLVGYLYTLDHDLNNQRKIDQVVNRGMDTQAVVIDKQERLVSTKSGRKYQYTLAFRYQVAGRDHTGRQLVGSQTYSRKSIGDAVSVRYLPGEPGFVYLWGPDRDDGELPTPGVSAEAFWLRAMFVMGAAAMLAGGFVAYRLIGESRHRRSLVLDGRLIFAPLTGCALTKSVWNPQIHLTYDLMSPVTKNKVGGSHVGSWTEDRSCPIDGMVAAVLFKDDEHYQVL